MFDPSRTLSLESLQSKSAAPEPVFRRRKRPRNEGLRRDRRSRSRSRSPERTVRARLSSPDSPRNSARFHPSRRSRSPSPTLRRREDRSPPPRRRLSSPRRESRDRRSISPPSSSTSADRSFIRKREPHSPSRSISECGRDKPERSAYQRQPSTRQDKISLYKQDVWDARSVKRAAHAREMRAVRELMRLGERVPAAADHGWEDDDTFIAELKSVTDAFERERRKRKRAEKELAGMKAAHETPFLVPALLEAFVEIDKLAEHEPRSTRGAQTRSVSRSWQEP